MLSRLRKSKILDFISTHCVCTPEDPDISPIHFDLHPLVKRGQILSDVVEEIAVTVDEIIPMTSILMGLTPAMDPIVSATLVKQYDLGIQDPRALSFPATVASTQGCPSDTMDQPMHFPRKDEPIVILAGVLWSHENTLYMADTLKSSGRTVAAVVCLVDAMGKSSRAKITEDSLALRSVLTLNEVLAASEPKTCGEIEGIDELLA